MKLEGINVYGVILLMLIYENMYISDQFINQKFLSRMRDRLNK